MTAYTADQFALIETHRNVNVNYNGWWDSTYDYFIEQTESLGLSVNKDDIQFSGFWSQGDGASFTANDWSLATILRNCMSRIDQHAALEETQREACMQHPVYKQSIDFAYEIRNKFAKFLLLGEVFGMEVLGGACVRTERTSRQYSHSRTVVAWWDTISAECGDYSEVFEESGLRVTLAEFNIDEAVEGFANALYKALQEEYEYLTSDEQVWDTIEANERYDRDEEESCEAA